MSTKSIVLDEFFKIVQKDGLLKEAYTQNPHAENKKTIEEKKSKEPETSIIEVAHPKPVYVAEAHGDGGLVENQIEQQERILAAVNKMPTGALLGSYKNHAYASLAADLLKMAEKLDQENKPQAADKFTKAAELILQSLDRPF